MIEHAKNLSLFLLVGLITILISNWLKSDFISIFLSENLITLLIALVAINTTTLSVVLTKIREISDKYGGNFSRTAKEMKSSIAEQVSLVILTAITQIAKSSNVINVSFPQINFLTDVILTSIFFYSIYMLYDTANSVFVILQFENQNIAKKEK